MGRPTMADVAREAGVSRALVSLVFRDMPNVSEQRRAGVLAAADRLGYRMDASARRMRSRRSGVIGVVISDLHNPVFAEIVDGIRDRAEVLGQQLLFAVGDRQSGRERAAIETLLQHRPDGMIVGGSQGPPASVISAAAEVPLVLLGRTIRDPNIDCFTVDEVLGARLAVEHLVGLGHRRIVHVDGGRGGGSADRRSGYRRAMAQLGLGAEVRVVPGAFTEEAGHAASRTMLAWDRRPSAVFAANDLVALGIIEGLRLAGVEVPGDVSVVGFDDTIFARLNVVNLTTVAVARRVNGAHALDALMERIVGSRTVPMSFVAEPHLVVRGTTAVARP